MATPYNIFNDEYKALQASRTALLDPAGSGTVLVGTVNYGILELTAAGTVTLEAAAQVPLGVSVLVLSQAAVTVNGVALADGGWVEFVVVKNSANANVWAVRSASGISAIVTTPIALGVVSVSITDADTQAAFLALINGLKAAGVVSGTFT